MESIMVRIVKKNLIILKILKKNNFINDFKFIKDDIIIIYLLYKNNKKI
jgi:ribosomal protein S8